MRGFTIIVMFLANVTLTAFAKTKHVNVMSESNVAHALRHAGFTGKHLAVMTCIAKHESNFNPNAINVNRNKSVDHGLLQINDVWKKSCKVTAHDLKNPYVNARCAATVYKAQGYNAWYAFKKHKHTCLTYKLSPTSTVDMAVADNTL